MLTIDRIEEGIAVCEKGDGSFVRLPARPGWAEGDVRRSGRGIRCGRSGNPGPPGSRLPQKPEN